MEKRIDEIRDKCRAAMPSDGRDDMLWLLERLDAAESEVSQWRQKYQASAGREQKAEASLAVAREALAEIAEGAGPYSLDALEHASNTIEAMQSAATEALSRTGGAK